MGQHSAGRRRPAVATCPRCGGPAETGTGGWLTCRCGRPWPAHPAEMPAEPVDVLGAAALTADRLDRFRHGPLTPTERAAARRHLDGLADR